MSDVSEQRRFYERMIDEIADENRKQLDALTAENTKLRELLRELYEDQCDECDRWKYRDRMRELGVSE